MKSIIFILLLLSTLNVNQAKAQEQELEQLALDIEKLNQLRSILNEMYKGYEIISKGYNTIKDLSEGNFNIHEIFLDGLLQVSPVVKNYKRVIDIISCQTQIVSEYKSAYSYFKASNIFNQTDLNYLDKVYSNLFNNSLKDLDELLMIVTARQLRMNDAERLGAIDNIYINIRDKLAFLRHFNNNTNLFASQKINELRENQSLKQIFGF